jgi:hypothetical protein
MPLYGTVPSFQDPEIPIDRMVVGYRWANCWNVHSSWYGSNFTAWIRWTNRNSSSMFETIFPRTMTSSTNRNQYQPGPGWFVYATSPLVAPGYPGIMGMASKFSRNARQLKNHRARATAALKFWSFDLLVPLYFAGKHHINKTHAFVFSFVGRACSRIRFCCLKFACP